MKGNIPDSQKEDIRAKIRKFIIDDSGTVASFSNKHSMSRVIIDKWFYDDRLPSIQSALKLERISKGKLTKEFLCPELEWNE